MSFYINSYQMYDDYNKQCILQTKIKNRTNFLYFCLLIINRYLNRSCCLSFVI